MSKRASEIVKSDVLGYSPAQVGRRVNLTGRAILNLIYRGKLKASRYGIGDGHWIIPVAEAERLERERSA